MELELEMVVFNKDHWLNTTPSGASATR